MIDLLILEASGLAIVVLDGRLSVDVVKLMMGSVRYASVVVLLVILTGSENLCFWTKQFPHCQGRHNCP